jgi:hypothetical protein
MQMQVLNVFFSSEYNFDEIHHCIFIKQFHQESKKNNNNISKTHHQHVSFSSHGGELNVMTSSNQFIQQMKSIDGLNYVLLNKTGVDTSINLSKCEVQVYLTFLLSWHRFKDP